MSRRRVKVVEQCLGFLDTFSDLEVFFCTLEATLDRPWLVLGSLSDLTFHCLGVLSYYFFRQKTWNRVLFDEVLIRSRRRVKVVEPCWELPFCHWTVRWTRAMFLVI